MGTLKRVYLQNFTIKKLYLNLGPIASDLHVFWMEFEKNIVIFEINTLEFSNCEILRRKTPNFCTKTLLLGISKREFSKTIVIFEINTFKFV